MYIIIRIAYSIILLGLLLTCTPDTSPPSVTAPPVQEPNEITHWLQENAIKLASTEPQANYDDLMPLKDLIGDAQIVALGSATLGTHEFFTIQNRLLDFLARELNFNVVVLDVNMPEAEIMNDYIQEGLGKPRELLGIFYKWNYSCEEMLDIIYWMRNYRHNAGTTGSLDFKGVLARYPLYAMYQVVQYLSQVDTTAALNADSLYLYFRLQHRSFYDRKKEWLKQVCREGIIAVHNILLENQALYITLTSEEEYAKALRLAYFVIQVERY
ncbi:MAG: erythromycin esterase family protein, partial [bacterium]